MDHLSTPLFAFPTCVISQGDRGLWQETWEYRSTNFWTTRGIFVKVTGYHAFVGQFTSVSYKALKELIPNKCCANIWVGNTIYFKGNFLWNQKLRVMIIIWKIWKFFFLALYFLARKTFYWPQEICVLGISLFDRRTAYITGLCQWTEVLFCLCIYVISQRLLWE
jgi:hypothetical protein